MAWTWVLTDGSGNALAELANADGRTLRFKRNTPAEASCTVSHDDPETIEVLTANIPRLKCYRDGTLRFHGALSSIDEQADTQASQVVLNFVHPDKLLATRFTTSTHAATDAGTIAWTLINSANSDDDTGIRQGTINTTKSRTREYRFKQVLEAIQQLTAVLDGFDYEVVATEDADDAAELGTITVWQAQGSDQSDARFEYGAGTLANCSSITRQLLPPVNAVTLEGENGLTVTVTDAASITRYGRYDVFESRTDIADQATLTERAREKLRITPVRILQFTPDPKLAPAPFTGYFLGDTVRFAANRNALDIPEMTPRVQSIEIRIDSSGNESDHVIGIDDQDATL